MGFPPAQSARIHRVGENPAVKRQFLTVNDCPPTGAFSLPRSGDTSGGTARKNAARPQNPIEVRKRTGPRGRLQLHLLHLFYAKIPQARRATHRERRDPSQTPKHHVNRHGHESGTRARAPSVDAGAFGPSPGCACATASASGPGTGNPGPSVRIAPCSGVACRWGGRARRLIAIPSPQPFSGAGLSPGSRTSRPRTRPWRRLSP